MSANPMPIHHLNRERSRVRSAPSAKPIKAGKSSMELTCSLPVVRIRAGEELRQRSSLPEFLTMLRQWKRI
jgi:hypothetical protein